MRVFVTGATGYVGSAVVKDLIANGHQVLGLVRSTAAADTLAALGAKAHVGDLRERDDLKAGIKQSDAVIHTAFDHDFSKFVANCEIDREVIAYMGGELAGTNRPLVVASPLGALPAGDMATEADMPLPASNPARHPRALTEDAADLVADMNVPVSVVRLPPSVHGKGDHAFVPALINIAREKGVAAYIGEGKNRWSAVHRDDAARLFRRALEIGATGARYHAVGEEGISFADIAAAIGAGLGVPATSITDEAAAAHFTWFANFARMDIPASSAVTQRALDWKPTGLTLIEDLVQSGYFIT